MHDSFGFYNRKPEQFDGQRVLILGGGASGTDIAVEVAGKASKVVLQCVQWTPETKSLNSCDVSVQKVSKQPAMSGVSGPQQSASGLKDAPKCRTGGFLLSGLDLTSGAGERSGQVWRRTKVVPQRWIRGPNLNKEPGILGIDVLQVEAEAVILATGYHYNFPFLTPECGVKVENRVVQPLFKHLISIANPSLAFVGLPVQVLCKFNILDTKFSLSDLPLPSV